ncbi:MAG: carbon-phosphorus lyase complex subunit PhnI [Rhizobacter sp.]|nr:carbon-phosphorus lyase complex subunit PhnI [Rhizobacter sp.]
MYIAVKGGEAAIEASRALLAAARRGDPAVRELEVAQIREQLGLLVDRVMAEASLYDPELAALALKQARGDAVEAVFLLRAYRTTLPRVAATEPLDTERMRVRRRVSAIFKDLPGGQLLGPTFDYTQRLVDFSLMEDASVHTRSVRAEPPPSVQAEPPPSVRAEPPPSVQAEPPPSVQAEPPPSVRAELVEAAHASIGPSTSSGRTEFGASGPSAGSGRMEADSMRTELASGHIPNALDALNAEGLIEPVAPSEGDPVPPDITRDPPVYPLPRSARLQMLARADEGWVLGMGYATQRGYAHTHPFAGDIRFGAVTVEIVPDELGFAIEVGEIDLTECQMVNQFAGSASVPPQFTRGYGLVYGHGERKAMAMSLVDRALRADEFDEDITAPVQSQEFVLPQGDSLEASGFVQHLKLPHYVTFESELQLIRKLRDVRPSSDEYIGRSPEGIAGRLGSGPALGPRPSVQGLEGEAS